VLLLTCELDLCYREAARSNNLFLQAGSMHAGLAMGTGAEQQHDGHKLALEAWQMYGYDLCMALDALVAQQPLLLTGEAFV